jgi:hypothetical protein
MVPLEFLEKFKASVPEIAFDPSEFRREPATSPTRGAFGKSKEGRSPEEIQEAMDRAQPDRSRQGPVFFTGEEIEIKGGRFRVAEIMGDRLILEGIPLLTSHR